MADYSWAYEPDPPEVREKIAAAEKARKAEKLEREAKYDALVLEYIRENPDVSLSNIWEKAMGRRAIRRLERANGLKDAAARGILKGRIHWGDTLTVVE